MSNRIVSRIRNRERAVMLHSMILEWLKSGPGRRSYLREYLRAYSANDLRLLLVHVHVVPDQRSKAANLARLLQMACYNLVYVDVSITWGRKFDGSYLAPTPGVGFYATVMEMGGNHFRGCPLGSSHTSVEAAIADFVSRARPAYTGEGAFTRANIIIAKTYDTRTKESQ